MRVPARIYATEKLVRTNLTAAEVMPHLKPRSR